MKIEKAPIKHNYAEAQRDADHIYYMQQLSDFLKKHEDKHYSPEEWEAIKEEAGLSEPNQP